MKEIYLAGGCFWGVQHYLDLIGGITETETGYANGSVDNPSYLQVYTDTTGFAETVHVVFNDTIISLENLLELYFLCIDPLSVNKQGNDTGTRYRTGIYYTSEEDAKTIMMVMRHKAEELGAKPAVEVSQLKNFYKATEYHQKYLEKIPGGYCHIGLNTFKLASESQKSIKYMHARKLIKAILDGDLIAGLANTSAILHEQLDFFWVGFYLVRKLGGETSPGRELSLGPFQGPAACTRIRYGKGVCGTAWSHGETIIVDDVEKFPGHIACSSLSRSEIVVPIMAASEISPADPQNIVGVLDVDSLVVSGFDYVDQFWLEKLAHTLSNDLIWHE